ncbi:MAG: hypothetical protein J6A92_05220 [Lachnospiraceae bacterium]|nr:hypothetical protein [Lachnospiraceae bacterium]
MGKNERLANIYIKIYNKKPLLMEDLLFLSTYDPECFEKTCRNLVYNVPEAKKLMEADVKPTSIQQEQSKGNTVVESQDDEKPVAEEAVEVIEETAEAKKSREIENLLENLKHMEWKKQVMQDIPVDKVKNLLGSLYMEMLFPHNDRTQSFPLDNTVESTFFNKKV